MKTNELQTPLQKAFYKLRKAELEIERLKSEKEQEIAVIGIALNLPGASSLDSFWKLLSQKKSAIGTIKKERAGLNYGSKNILPGNAGFLDRIDFFDSKVFGITPIEARLMNPAHRLFLQNAWRALEDAGYCTTDRQNGGVFLGYSGDLAFSEYLDLVAGDGAVADSSVVVGNASSVMAGRVAHELNLTGPVVVLDTACSSSLVAVHYACQSLRNEECDFAIAAGVNINVIPSVGKFKVGFESASGSVYPFDERADGTIEGEGVVSLVLKRKSKAIEDGDYIYGVIYGSAVIHDGKSTSLTAPNAKAQEDLVTEAWKMAGQSVERLAYIETHGTGTALGDPIELSALENALKHFNPEKPVYIGALKANIGHLFASAGITGLVKCLLIQQYRKIPGQINHQNPIAALKESAIFQLNTETVEFPENGLTAVSSFGFSGTNCHLILGGLEQVNSEPIPTNQRFPVTFSAKSFSALEAQLSETLQYLSLNADLAIDSISYSRNCGRKHFEFRVMLWAGDTQELISEITTLLNDQEVKKAIMSPVSGSITELQERTDLYLKALENSTADEKALTDFYRSGVSINWDNFYAANGKQNRIPLPGYVFDEISYWPEKELNRNSADDYSAIGPRLIAMVAQMTEIPESELSLEEEFFSFGIDSLILLQVIEAIKKDFNLTIGINQFYNQITNLKQLIDFVEQNGNVSVNAVSEEQVTVADSQPSVTDLGIILDKLNNIEKRFLSANNGFDRLGDTHNDILYGKPLLEENRSLTGRQADYIGQFIATYTAKTKASREYASGNKQFLADWINSIDYRHSLKELLYPIVTSEAKGAYATDIDGNTYIDIGLGYGVSFFGNNPGFINEALIKQVNTGTELAFQSILVERVAKGICELTGVERVALSNTGTEAVMAAIRIARAKTKKRKIVIFTGGYHGTFDGVLGLPGTEEGSTIPISKGTPPAYVHDLVVLNFGAEQSLDYIRNHYKEIAGVLVEPVQSRKPGVHSPDFLKRLRTITNSNNIALIFDEIITGFRIGTGGAQKHFDVQADIVTYGKVIGGGMPIGVIAGKREYIDLIDGGNWTFGDNSYPETERVLFGGTFCKHPLTLASMLAVIERLKKEGDDLYNKVNQLMESFAKQANDYFRSVNAPIEIVHFGSLFRFEFKGKYQALNNPFEIPLFFYHLMQEGVYTWERRVCFLSTEHTASDINRILEAVKRAYSRMNNAGFFSEEHNTPEIPALKERFELNHSQQRIWFAEQIGGDQSAYNLGYAYKITGNVSVDLFEKTCYGLLKKHDLLRANFKADTEFTPYLEISKEIDLQRFFSYVEIADEVKALGHAKQVIWNKFDIEKDGLFRFCIIRSISADYLVMCAHHLVADGWSLGVLLDDFSKIFNQLQTTGKVDLPPVELSFRDIINDERTYFNSDKSREDQAFWLKQLEGDLPLLDLPVYKKRPVVRTYNGKTKTYGFPTDTIQILETATKENNWSLFSVLQGLIKILLFNYTDQSDIIVGTSVHGRDGINKFGLVGNFVNTIPLRSRIVASESLRSYFEKEKKALFSIFEHQNYPFDKIVDDLQPERDFSRSPIFDILVQLETGNLANYHEIDKLFSGITFEEVVIDDESSEKDLFLEFVKVKNDLKLRLNYNTDVFEEFQMDRLVQHFEQLVEVLSISGLDTAISEINILTPEEEEQLAEWNDTELKLPDFESYTDVFERQVTLNPTAVALSCNGEEFTYERLNLEANRVANFIIGHPDYSAGELIGVLMDRSPEMHIAILGIWKSGRAYIPLDPKFPAKRIATILEQSAVRIVLVDQHYTELIQDLSNNTPDFVQVKTIVSEMSDEYQPVRSGSNDLAYTLFTSGSTGLPKGAMIEHLGMLNHMYAMIDELELGVVPPPVSSDVVPASIFQEEVWKWAHVRGLSDAAWNCQTFSIPKTTASNKQIESAYAKLLELYPVLRTGFCFVNNKLQQTLQPLASFCINWEKESRLAPVVNSGYHNVSVKDREEQIELSLKVHTLLTSQVNLSGMCADFLKLINEHQIEQKHSKKQPDSREMNWEDYLVDFQGYEPTSFIIGKLNQRPETTVAKRFRKPLDLRIPQSLQGKISEEEYVFALAGLLLRRYAESDKVLVDVAFDLSEYGIYVSNELPVVCDVVLRNSAIDSMLNFIDKFRNTALLKGTVTSGMIEEKLLQKYGASVSLEKRCLFSYSKDLPEGELYPEECHSLYDLAFNFVASDSGLILELIANKQALPEYVSQMIPGHLEELSASLNKNLEAELITLDYIPLEVRKQLIVQTESAAEFVTVLERFNQQAAQHPNHPAVVIKDKQWSYGEIHAGMLRWAKVLQSNGVKAGDRIGVHMKRSEELLMLLFAIQKLRAVYVPLDIHLPRERFEFIINDTGLSIVAGSEKTKEITDKTVLTGTEILNEEISELSAETALPEDLFSILYTSGTTGVPKGVCITAQNIASLLDWAGEEFTSVDFEHVLSTTPISFDVSMFDLFFPLCEGKTILMTPDDMDNEDAEAFLTRYDKIMVNTSPTSLGGYFDAELDLSSVVAINLAGEPVPVSYRRFFKDRENLQVRNLYGPTETTVYSTCYLFDNRYPDIVPIGTPVTGDSILLLDAQLQPVPPGFVGQIAIGGKGVAAGYLNREDLTSEKFIQPEFDLKNRYYLTGDLARLLPDGTLEFLGRRDNQVNIRGYRIELGEIENVLNQHPFVQNSTASVVITENGDNHIVVHYVGDEQFTDKKVRNYLLEKLPFYMIPAFVLKIDSFPKTLNGKIDKKALPLPFGQSTTGQHRQKRIVRYKRPIGAAIGRPAVIAQNASHCFDISVWQMFTGYLIGAKTVIYQDELIKDVKAFVEQVENDSVSVLQVVPSYLNLVLDLFESKPEWNYSWSGIRYLLVTGEAVKRPLVNRCFDFFPQIYLVNAYGPTEAADDITLAFIAGKEPDESKPVTIGKAIQNVNIHIVNSYGKPVPVGSKGMITVSGIAVGRGYIRDEERTRKVFSVSNVGGTLVRSYNTGDIGRYLPNGDLEFFGREDAQIKLRGNRIELGDIENALVSVKGITEACALLLADENEELQIVAFYVNDASIEQQYLRQALKKLIPQYMIPEIFVELEKMPLNANGKIDRKELRKIPARKGKDVGIDRIATNTDSVEQIVREAWKKVLGNNNFGNEDNFFEYGGNSLGLMKLFRILDDQFPEKLTVTDLFEQVTVADQAVLLKGTESSGNPDEVSQTIVDLEF